MERKGPLSRAARNGGGRVWWLRAHSENVRWLKANIDRNKIGGVAQIHRVAIGSRTGTARHGYREHGGGNAALLDATAADTIAVRVVRIDDLDFPQRVSFIKMDVEGFELEVLRGARDLIERHRPAMESSTQPGCGHGARISARTRWIVTLGYDVYAVEEHRSARWRPKDVATLRRLQARFEPGRENLLLPTAGRTARAAPDAGLTA